jgi:hypothetical protein
MKYRINLKPYDVDFDRWEIVDGERKRNSGREPLNVKSEIYEILRIPGVYKDGVETCDGVDLANRIKNSDDFIDIEVKELSLIKKVFNVLIAREHKPQIGQIALGGDRYIELIQRVFKAEEVSE